MSEILFKVGDSGGYRDGDIIAIMPDGWLISAADMAAWLVDGKEPAVLGEMPKYVADGQRRRLDAVRWKVAHTAVEIEAEYRLPKGAGEMEKTDADRDAAEFSANGLDTNWGTSDLKSHAVVRVTDLTGHEQAELLERDWDRTKPHNPHMAGKSSHRVDYAAALSAAKVTDLRDATKRVDVDRTAALAKSIVVAASQADVKPSEKVNDLA